jgi:hypothetical protein
MKHHSPKTSNPSPNECFDCRTRDGILLQLLLHWPARPTAASLLLPPVEGALQLQVRVASGGCPDDL